MEWRLCLLFGIRTVVATCFIDIGHLKSEKWYPSSMRIPLSYTFSQIIITSRFDNLSRTLPTSVPIWLGLALSEGWSSGGKKGNIP